MGKSKVVLFGCVIFGALVSGRGKGKMKVEFRCLLLLRTMVGWLAGVLVLVSVVVNAVQE